MPLTDKQAVEFIREAQKRGASKEQIKAALDREGVGMSVNLRESPMQSQAIAEQPPAPGQPWTDKQTKRLIRGGLTMGGGLAAGLATGGASIPIQMGAEALGAMGGRFLGNFATDNPLESKVAETGVGTVVGSGVTRMASGLLSRMAGIPPAISKYVGDVAKANPIEAAGLVTRRVAPEEPLRFGEVIQNTFKKVAGEITGGRLEKESINQAANSAKVRIPITSVVDSLRAEKVANASEPTAIAFNKQLEKFATNLWKRGKGKGLTPSEFDRFMIDELDEKVFTKSGDVAGTRMGRALGKVRAEAKELYESELEKAGFPTIRQANAKASEELSFREDAEQVWGPGKLTLEQRVRNLWKPGHQKDRELLERLGKEAGIPDLLERSKKLSTRMAFTTDPLEAEKEVGVFRQFLLAPISKYLGKVIAPSQGYVGPASGTAIGPVAVETFEGLMKRPERNP